MNKYTYNTNEAIASNLAKVVAQSYLINRIQTGTEIKVIDFHIKSATEQNELKERVHALEEFFNYTLDMHTHAFKKPQSCGLIVDYIGFDEESIELLQKVDFRATFKSIAKSYGFSKYYTLNSIAKAIDKVNRESGSTDFRLSKDGKPSSGQKNLMRYDGVKGRTILPNKVIIITPAAYDDPSDYISYEGTGCTSNGKHPLGTGDYGRTKSVAYKAANAWAELSNNNVEIWTISESLDTETINIEKQLPVDLFNEFNNVNEITLDSKSRKCAAIWGAALGWEFSSPLYEQDLKVKLADYFCKRNTILRMHEDAYEQTIGMLPLRKEAIINMVDNPIAQLNTFYSAAETATDKRAAWLLKAATTSPVHREALLASLKEAAFSNFADLRSACVSEADSQPASSNAKFQLYHRICPDSEVQEFKDYFNTLSGYDKVIDEDGNVTWVKSERPDMHTKLMPGYQLCPVCKKHPIRLDVEEFDLSEFDNPEAIMIRFVAAKSDIRWIQTTKTEFKKMLKHLKESDPEKYKLYKMNRQLGVIKIASLESAFKAMVKENPAISRSCTCGFTIPGTFIKYSNSFSFDESRDSSETSAEMLTAGDDRANSLFETIAGFNLEFSSFDDDNTALINKYRKYIAERQVKLNVQKPVVVEEEKKLTVPSFSTKPTSFYFSPDFIRSHYTSHKTPLRAKRRSYKEPVERKIYK